MKQEIPLKKNLNFNPVSTYTSPWCIGDVIKMCREDGVFGSFAHCPIALSEQQADIYTDASPCNKTLCWSPSVYRHMKLLEIALINN